MRFFQNQVHLEQWSSGAPLFWCLFFTFANQAGHVVELEALGAQDGEALVVVLPGGENEKLAAGTSFHTAAAGLG